MAHPTNLEGANLTNHALGFALGGLRYDQLGEVLLGLAARIDHDARSDAARGRRGLAFELNHSSLALNELLKHIEKAQKICAPYMVTEMERNKPVTVTVTRSDTLRWDE
ncbi:hypothetical protein A3C89_02585 [Candidatus Kaiserbacteria bacterium RIFCSPHIGHO2_02_FULL_50_50]|uniref:Uncharacterized protein n=1 Tax=Candidatus Kaiserbacteria bacterium RIFCSPHIGHO2_02_FULL_50_50 TaxID=1798492 RepID=A0A1F6DD89_9BACT|nr:MAG: hypothetical protein A3C89_02585 [Candidatus Kaiserbacteria bacterium RIFCSPHIGHO2_02_FULL_50_50]OGG88000.1 MAG: hypothetical protein A3G62_03600 [Candidatus Kaiserbacteria bacterium RIFCSPLOWO2_12_FULL_50_10]